MTKEESLKLALEASSLQKRGLPPQYKNETDSFWIRAIVLVRKRNLEECYCLYRQNADRYMRLMKDCGSGTGIIERVLSIHPYTYLDIEQFMPSGCLEARKAYLKSNISSDVSVDDMTEEEVDHTLLELAIERQLKNEESDRITNQRNEGYDLDGTNIEEIERQRYETELRFMIKDGCSQKEIKAFKEEFARRNDKKDEEIPYIPEEEATRTRIEEADEERLRPQEPSTEGEFDPPIVDIDKVVEDTKKYREDLQKQYKRKWARNNVVNIDKKEGRVMENEFGEDEEIETLQVAPPRETGSSKKKPGRPKKQARAAVTRKKNAELKKITNEQTLP